MGKVRTSNTFIPTPIEQYLLSVDNPSVDDFEAIKAIATLPEDIPASQMILNESIPSHLVKLFQTASDSEKINSIHFARNEIANQVLGCDSPKFLNNIAQFVLKTLHTHPQHLHAQFIVDFSIDAFLRLAMVNQEIALGAFSLLLERLTLKEKKWLYLTLHLEQTIQRYQFNNESLEGPAFVHTSQSHTGKCVLLYLHWPQLREKFKACFNVQSDTDLVEVEHKHQQLIRHQLSENIDPFVSTYFPKKSPKSLEIQRDLSRYSPETIAWFFVNSLSNEPVDFNEIAQSVELRQQLALLQRQYEREELLFELKQKCPPTIFAQALAMVERNFDTQIKSLSFDARRWLFLVVMLEDENYITDNYPKPTGHELGVCQEFQALASNSPYVTRLLHQRLVSRLGQDEPSVLFSYISRFIHQAVDKFPDQMRLWQYLALETNSQPLLFSATPHSIHENFNSRVFSMTMSTPLTLLFKHMAQYSSYVRNMIYHALLTKQIPDPTFDKSINQLDLYENHFVSTQLHSCDENTLCWLYFTIATNMHLPQIKLTSEKVVNKPQDRQWLHAQLVLQTIYANPDISPYYLKQIERTIPFQKLDLLQKIQRGFVLAKLGKISLDARKWLYWALKTRTYQGSFDTYTSQPLSLNKESKDDVAKILYMICNQPTLLPFVLESLTSNNAELSQLHPEVDQLGLFALFHNPDGELCYQQSVSEEASHQLLPLYMKSLSKTTRGWLAEGLTSGKINARELLQALPSHMPTHVAQEMKMVAQLLVLAIKWPSIRARVITECGGEAHLLPAFSTLILDKLQFSDKGMMALAQSLQNNCQQLNHFSALDTDISDDGIAALSENVLARAPLKIFLLHQNPKVSARALRTMLQKSIKHQSPAQQNIILSTLFGFILEPEILSGLYVRLNVTQDPALAHQIKKATSFYSSPDKNKAQIADLILTFAELSPQHLRMCQDMLHSACNPVIADDQLVFTTVHTHDPYFTHLTLQHILKKSNSHQIKDWLKKVIIEGKLALRSDQHFSPDEQLQCAQLFCLLLASNKVQRFELAQHLGIPLSTPIPDITEVSLHSVEFSDVLKVAMIKALSHHSDTIRKITCNGTLFNDEHIHILTQALMHKSQVKKLDVSLNPTTQDAAEYIALLIVNNKSIQHLNLSNCLEGDQSAALIAKALPRSNLKVLEMRHAPGVWPESHPIRITGATKLAKALQNPSCTLEELDLSDNEIDSLGANKLMDGATKKSSCTLKTLRLNHNNIGDHALLHLAQILTQHNIFECIEFNGHHAKAQTLQSFIPTLKLNNVLEYLDITPIYVAKPFQSGIHAQFEQVREARHYLCEIQDVLEMHLQERNMIKRLAALDIKKETPLKRSATPIRRCASQANLVLSEHSPVLQFSQSPQLGRRTQQPSNTPNTDKRREISSLNRSHC
ncbi:MAG: hypothetical protein HYX61_08755 [Gammaproteobacteria bacterium]|jgi:hypothetical protein|nr:hypothetical protein [Gammaproteobacteria bacterium]